MKSRLSWRVGTLWAASLLSCGADEADGPRIGLALDNAALRDEIRVVRIEGYRDRGLSCAGHALAGAPPASPDLGPLTISTSEWGVTFDAAAGSWVLHVPGGNDDFPIDGEKMRAEGCLAAGIAAGSRPTLTIAVFDLRPEYCGDSVLDVGEQCDDGDTAPDDGCDATCRYEAGVCGNSRVDADETCDDGTPPTAGDGCDATCQTEAFVLPVRSSSIRLDQAQPRVAAGTDAAGAGGFAVVWADESGAMDSSGWGVAIGFFDERGEPTANPTGGAFEFPLNPHVSAGNQDWPSVGWGSAGYLATFIDRSTTADWDAYLQPYGASRAVVGNELHVPAAFAGTSERQAVVGSHADVPGYVVAWSAGDSPARRIWLRTFSGTWPATSTDVQVQPAGADDEFLPAVAMKPDGSFAVVWVQGAADTSIRLARFTAAGAPSGTVETVAGGGDGSIQTEPAAAYDATGRLLVTWADGPSGTVMAKLYAATGEGSAAFSVSPGGLFPGGVESGHLTTSVAAIAGTYLVVWTTDNDTNVAVSARLVSGANTFVRNRFGGASDGAFRISPATHATRGRVAITPGGVAMVVWQDRDPFGADTDSGVRGRVFPVP
ncbi:MAG: hypothetical protein HY907_07870 [Deltaproteobacteria bacterium]|nr:hypothetical protein [Deltaproteobacteria bacterium]